MNNINRGQDYQDNKPVSIHPNEEHQFKIRHKKSETAA